MIQRKNKHKMKLDLKKKTHKFHSNCEKKHGSTIKKLKILQFLKFQSLNKTGGKSAGNVIYNFAGNSAAQ